MAFLVAASAGAQGLAPLYFQFNEASGAIARATAGNLTTQVAQWDPNGKSGSALLLDGGPATVTVLPKPREIGLSDLSVAFWMKPADCTFADLKDKRRRMIDLVERYPEAWCAIDVREGGVISVELGQKKNGGPNAGAALWSKPVATVGAWTHVAFTYERGARKIRLYINGALDVEKEVKAEFDAPLSSPKPTTLGAGFQSFKGSLDELKLFYHALDKEGVKAAMAHLSSGAAPASPAPVNRGAKSSEARSYYVSPQGNDGWSGTLPEPNASKTDGPLKTIEGAKGFIRKMKSGGRLNAPVTMALRGGTYRIRETLAFSPEDSGTSEAPITYAAYKDESPVISGGFEVKNWRQKGSVIETRIPSGTYFQELYVNGKRAVRSRHPNEGFFRIVGPGDPSDGQIKGEPFRYEIIVKPEDLREWENLSDVNLTLFHAWNASIHWLKSVDLANHKVVFANPSRYMGKYGEKNARYFLENCAEGFDAPGEWYLNRSTGVLKYMLRPGESPDSLEAIAPAIGRLLDFKGDPAAGKFVEHLSFIGIALRHTDWGFAPPLRDRSLDMADGQAGVALRYASIYAVGLRHATFERCEISHGGAHAMWFEKGCFDNAVRQCHIFDHGGGGVYIGDNTVHSQASLQTARITVENCYIHDLDHVMYAAAGIWIGRNADNIIRHNEISDLPYCPISVGWSWRYEMPSGTKNNVIEYNHLHHFGLGILSDLAGIYTLGHSPGTVIRYNHVHDANAYSYGGWGLYNDEGSVGILMEKNLVYNTKSGGWHHHYGSNNIVRNNIFAFSAEGNIISQRGDSKNVSFDFQRNIVLTTNGQVLKTGFTSKAFTLDRNLYWDLTDGHEESMNFSGKTFPDWKSAMGYDANSIVADPQFLDPRKFDFRLKKGSPALQQGFEPFWDEIMTAGLVGDANWRELPKKYKPRVVSSEMQAPAKVISMNIFSEDFETTAPGVPSPFGKGDEGILTSGEQAFKSKHSLRFLDSEENSADYKPQLRLYNGFKPGFTKGSLDVYLEEGAVFFHEWRQKTASGYAAGPSITIDASGALLAGRQEVAVVPREKWIRLEISCGIGKARTDGWDLAVTVDGEARKEYKGLRAPAELELLDWVAWCSMAKKRTVFYVDNVKFEVAKK
jgi:hypothetical protein